MAADIDALMRGEGSDPSTSHVSEYKNISNENIYAFMDNAHDGTGGFRDGSYLVPHSREMFYQGRRALAFYRNYLKPIVRAMLEPVFTEDAAFVVKQSEESETELTDSMMNEFVEDCDNAGTHLQDFIEDTMQMARLHGVTFIVMNNFTSEEMPKTTLDAIRSRKLPYIYHKSAAEVSGMKPTSDTTDDTKFAKLDRFGRIEEIIFVDEPDLTDRQDKRRFERWTKTTVEQLKIEGTQWKALKTTPHNLGRVPVIAVYAAKRKSLRKLLVDPPLYDLARVNHALFNKDSEIRSQERSQGFAIFYLQTDQRGDLVLGDTNALYLPTDASMPPGFASPPPAILEQLWKGNDRLREEIFRLAEQNGVTGVQDTKSGIAKQWDFFAHESVLKQTSAIARETVKKLSELFTVYTKEQSVVSAEFPTDFAPNDTKAELETYEMYDGMVDNFEAKKLLAEKATRLIFRDEDPERVAKVIKSIQDESEDEFNSKKKAAEPPNPFQPKPTAPEDEDDKDEGEENEDDKDKEKGDEE